MKGPAARGFVCAAAAALAASFAEVAAASHAFVAPQGGQSTAALRHAALAGRKASGAGTRRNLHSRIALAAKHRHDAAWWPKEEMTSDRAMLVLVRHGQSEWNFANRFIGWYDSPLTEEGEWEAEEAGRLLKDHDIEIDEVHVSMLERTIKSAKLATAVMREAGLEVPQDSEMRATWRLNERSYGALTGRNKKECSKEFGKDQLKIWRRSWDVPPPASKDGEELYEQQAEAFQGRVNKLSSKGLYDMAADPPPSELPRGESLKCTQERVLPYYRDVLLPKLKEGKRVMVFGHENNLRALIKHLDDIDNDAILEVDLPRAMPLVYMFDRTTTVEAKHSSSQALRLQPVKLTPPDAREGADLLSARYLVDQELITAFHKRDVMNVYDTSVEENLEEVCPIDEEDDMCKTIGEYLHDPSEEPSDKFLVGEPVIIDKRGKKEGKKEETSKDKSSSTAFLTPVGLTPLRRSVHSLPAGEVLTGSSAEQAQRSALAPSILAVCVAAYLAASARRPKRHAAVTGCRAQLTEVDLDDEAPVEDEIAANAIAYHFHEDALPSYFPSEKLQEMSDTIHTNEDEDDEEDKQEICELLGLDMGETLDRMITKAFNEEELKHAYGASGMTAAKPSKKPSAVWLIGPSACGKSTLAETIPEWVGDHMAEDGHVTIDGEFFRDSHTGYQEALQAGQQNGCVWWGAYVGVRQNINDEKQKLLELAASQGKNLMIPSTCLRRSQCVDVAQMLIEKGYTIHIVGVYGDKDVIVKRGQKRAMDKGKRYDPREFEIALTMFAPMLRLCTGLYRMVCTTVPGEGMHQLVTSEGHGPLEESEIEKVCTTTFKALLGEEAYLGVA